MQASGIDKRGVGRIMQKLGQKGTTEEGLMDLYHYMQKHPHLKLDQIMNLSVASATFRKYLEDGLKKAAYRDRLAKAGAWVYKFHGESCCSLVSAKVRGHTNVLSPWAGGALIMSECLP